MLAMKWALPGAAIAGTSSNPRSSVLASPEAAWAGATARQPMRTMKTRRTLALLISTSLVRLPGGGRYGSGVYYTLKDCHGASLALLSGGPLQGRPHKRSASRHVQHAGPRSLLWGPVWLW